MTENKDQFSEKQTPKLDEFMLRDRLRDMRTRIPDDPWLNPIMAVAFELSRQLEAGELEFEDVKSLAERLMDRACVNRALHIRERVDYKDHRTTQNDFIEFLQTTTDALGACGDGKDSDACFAEFSKRWERARVGVVLTAHPTFALSDALSRRMIEIAVTNDAGQQELSGYAHRPDDPIDLKYEHTRAQDAVRKLRSAYDELLSCFFSFAADRFGPRAYSLRPDLMTFASWVGYDLDGRVDITWLDSFALRLSEKHAALIDIRERFLIIRHRLGDETTTQRVCRQITGKLDLAIAAVEEHINAVGQIDEDHRGLVRAANVVSKSDTYNLTSTKPLLELLDTLNETVETPQMKRSVASLASLIHTTKLGTAHIHVRINAAQLNNAFRAFVHESWTQDLSEGQALAKISEMIATVHPESVNFGTLELETATAIRQFALIGQIQKHVDSEAPIRFLVAECEAPSTILIAVFFAKLFGVSDNVDISPLFETPDGLEQGARLMRRLLQEPGYRNYVQSRGRLCIQTGFSDAGRFVGQITATLAIERLHHALATEVAQSGLKDVETLIFSTHGESMGRGAHPGKLKQRLRYVFSDESRRRFEDKNLAVKHETSFQGGDGFTFFANRTLTSRALATIIMDGEVGDVDDDPFYADESLSLDFYLRLKAYQQDVFKNNGYRALLGAFGPNLLFKTGSRAVKRQSDQAAVQDRGDPARMRAIPNNAILQQFGYIANVVAGLGAAVGTERDRFIVLAKTSKRLRTCLEMIARGKQLSSLNAMGANASIFDAGFWASRASWGREEGLESAFRDLSEFLLNDQRDVSIKNLTHHLRLDAIHLHQILEEIGLKGGKIPDDTRLELDLLHAVRLALIMRIFILSAQLPRFAPRNDMSRDQLMALALGLDVPEVLSFIRETFPHDRAKDFEGRFDEASTYRPHGIDDYGRLETEILLPMEEAYDFVREIGTGISHHMGAFG
ncbi:MAG: phosphoenolpyruvate carboxylase [Hyphomicrobiaceae bacterium]